MKKLLMLVIVLSLSYIVVNAQGGPQRRTVEERVQTVHQKMDSAFKPGDAKLKEMDGVFTEYYKAQDKIREELTAGGERPDMNVMREKMQPFIEERDNKLKKILTEEQFKTWKEQIEPSLRPQRRQG